MNPDDLAQILDDLGHRLGPTGEYVFALAVRQVYIDGALSVGLGLLCTAVAVVITLGCRRLWRREVAEYAAGTSDYCSKPDPFMYYIFGGLAGGGSVVFALGTFSIGLPLLLNPEYAAIRDILRAIGR